MHLLVAVYVKQLKTHAITLLLVYNMGMGMPLQLQIMLNVYIHDQTATGQENWEVAFYYTVKLRVTPVADLFKATC